MAAINWACTRLSDLKKGNLAALVLLCFSLQTPSCYAGEGSDMSQGKGIKISDIKNLSSLDKFERKLTKGVAPGLRYFQFGLSDGTQVSLLHCDPAESRHKLRLAARVSSHTRSTSNQAQDNEALAALNGGYFNLSDGKSASYVIVSGSVQADPKTNQALLQNPKLKAFMPAILNRSELRIMKDDKGNFHYGIASHEEPLPAGLILVDSLQGGPRLLPNLTATEEAFVRTEPDGSQTDSIGVKRTAARTAIGLCEKDQFILVSVAGKKQEEFSEGLTLANLAELMSKLGVKEALNFDGGTSTTLVLKGNLLPSSKNYNMLVGREPETLVKSTLCLIEQK